MNIVDDAADLPATAPGAPICVLARPADTELVERALGALGADRSVWPDGPRALRRPAVHVVQDRIAVLALLVGEDERPVPVRMLATGSGLLVVADAAALAVLRPAADRCDDGPSALVAALLALAHSSGETLEDLVEHAQQLDARAGGYASAAERRQLTALRSRLFGVVQAQAAQHRLLTPEEELAQVLEPTAGRALRQAAAAFDDNRATAERLYALIGDMLAEQDTVVTERLTLVNIIFLPLSLATGFFGMNFLWLTDRIGSLPAFLGLGLLAPVLLAAATMVVIRRLSTGR